MNHDPATALIALYNRALALKRLPRSGWLQRGVAAPESVADHVFGVGLLALLVGDQVEGIDRGRLLAIALLHDLAETLTGDLPLSARRLLGADVKRDMERAAFAELLHDHAAAAEYTALWEEYVGGASREARFVKALDRIELLAQALAYERAGNRALGEFWRGADDGWGEEFPLVRDMARALITMRNQKG